MNLTDYPTPKSDEILRSITWGLPAYALPLRDAMRQFEQQAAAWRWVAEAIHSASKLDELQAAHESFDSLKSQLTKP